MKLKLFALTALLAFTLAPLSALAATGSTYPSTILTNQFGETSINLVKGGSGQLDCKFSVASTNVNGLGISGLVGTPCAAVYMHTTQTPATGNPNPAAGYILVKLASNYFGFLGGYSEFVSPLSGQDININTTLVSGNPYVISVPGTATAAQWQSIGLPAGLIPTLGQAFISNGSTVGSSGAVETPATSGSGASLIDIIGATSQSVAATGGARVLLRVLAPTSSSVTTLAAKAPADSSIIHLRFVMLPLSSQLK